MSTLFVTGGSGFIGRRFLDALDQQRWARVHVLTPAGEDLPACVSTRNQVRSVTGDLLDVDAYRQQLGKCDTVVHLAAVTGKAPRDAYRRVNVDGTRALLDASRDAGITRFLFVSSIAVRYVDRSHYYYAESKREAEQIVRASGLPFLIARPTIVIGRGGASWKSLSQLASLPLVPVLGSHTRIQPIYVDDVAAALHALLAAPFRGDTVELGGPEVTTFGGLLREAHYLLRGRRPWTVTVPVRPIVRVLTILEAVMRAALPVSAGQLAAFQNDGTVHPAHTAAIPLPPMKSVRDMLRLAIANG